MESRRARSQGPGHFLRDVARQVLKADWHAKVQMRRNVRGLRSVERSVLKHQRKAAEASPKQSDPRATLTATAGPETPVSPERDSAAHVSWIIRAVRGSDLLPYRTAPRPTLPACGANPTQDHEEGTIQEETSESIGGTGAS